jgi:uncharacterized GH25 family protein
MAPIVGEQAAGRVAGASFSVRAGAELALRWSWLVAAMVAPVGAAGAHDFWLQPSTFHPKTGTTVSVGLRVGQDFIGDPVPYQSKMAGQFFVIQEETRQAISGTENFAPAGDLRASGRTTAVIGYSTSGSLVDLPADRFEAYLKQHGLDQVIAERRRRGESDKPGRERFYRYAKALLSGPRSSPAATLPVGFAYEIVPDEDPTVRFGAFKGHVLYRGEPAAAVLIEALLHDDPSVRLSVRADARGGFSLVLPRGGVWLVKSVHMTRAGFFSSVADWESSWASLTFDMPVRP